jgi:hypothetical protein
MRCNIPISTAPAVEPAMIERSALGRSLGLSGTLGSRTVAILKVGAYRYNFVSIFSKRCVKSLLAADSDDAGTPL